MEIVSEARAFGGVQSVWRHESAACGGTMRFAVFTPPAAAHGPGPHPTLVWLSGLTCTEENFVTKAGAQRAAAELGLVVVAPDTSPRGPDADGALPPDDPDGAYDLGLGAGFYVDATAPPWSARYRMWRYVTEELPRVAAEAAPIDRGRIGVAGHSMGGHGALVAALRKPDLFRSVSAFAPIVAPSRVPWGRKAFTHYLGADETAWRAYDATALLEDGAKVPDLLVDQGEADPFLEEQLRPSLLAAACAAAGVNLTLSMRPGYDHSYFFIASFIDDHLAWHRERLG